MRVRLAASFDKRFVGGRDSVNLAMALTREGVDVVLEPMGLRGPLPAGFLHLLTKDPDGHADVHLTYGSPEYLDPAGMRENARAAVGWVLWPDAPGLYEPGTFELDGLDLCVVDSPDDVAALQAVNGRVPYSFCPSGVEAEAFPELVRSPAVPLTFGIVGDYSYAEEQWRVACGMDPGLAGRLLYLPAAGTKQDRLKAYAQCDVLVATVSSRESDLQCLEFQCTGGPVVASRAGGHLNWLHPDSGWPVEVVGDSVELAEAFQRVALEPGEVRRKGELAARTVRAELSWDKVAKRFLRQVSGVM